MTDGRVELRPICPDDDPTLTRFFDRLTAEDRKHFHPHPFTVEVVRRLTRYAGRDLYLAVFIDKEIAGYGMLRGWDEGYETPSLGIVILESFRGHGLGRLMMEYLHTLARLRGATMIRLNVYPANKPALNLYRDLGYQFECHDERQQLVGTRKL